MKQIELSIDISPQDNEESEILLALLAEAGFESFREEDNRLYAYSNQENLIKPTEDILQDISEKTGKKLNFEVVYPEEKNWNEEWEKNFIPIHVDNRILIKTPFHKVPDLEYTIIIEPKMSFGTGHHETTRLMLREMLRIDFKQKEVLDMGCGTGVLGITASLMGASYVLAVDIDPWAYQNTVENLQLNNIWQPFDVYPGDSSSLEGHTFHYILANINRNILLNDMPVYTNSLKENGILIISGILKDDRETLLKRANDCGLTFISSLDENNWISLNLRK